MTEYVLAGLALGSIYAIAASSLVVTYVSAGVVNFAFGAMAYAVARFYYWLQGEHGWSIWPAAALSLLVFAPALGLFLYLFLFQHLRTRPQIIKIVATVGLSVAIPPAVLLIFGNQEISQATGLAHRPLRVFHVFGSPVNMDQVNTYIALVLVVVIGTLVLRFTDAGLKVRAMVDSQAMSSLSGISPARVSLGVWAASGFLAGLAGILLAPTNGISSDSMTILMAAAFAPMIAAKLRSLPMAVFISLLMGVVTDVIQKYLPPNSSFTTALVPSIPFGFVVIFLIYYLVRGGSVNEEVTGGGALDKAIEIDGGSTSSKSAAVVINERARRFSVTQFLPIIPAAAVLVLPLLVNGYWLDLVTSGLALSVALLSFTLVVGDGGMIWLSQITFAGGGAILAAQLATEQGWPPMIAAIVASLCMVPIGVLLGALTIRLGDLYVALVTLTFGLLAETLIFKRDKFYNFGAGVDFAHPGGFENDRNFSYLCLIIFGILAIIIVNLRRSTAGLALNAVRWSEPAARTIGLSVVRVKLMVAGLASFAAGMGGCLIAMDAGSASADYFLTFTGLIWLAVLVTNGARSIVAALVAGLAYTVLPGIFATYVPTRWGSVPAILFGLGAIGVAANPDGVIAMQVRQVTALIGLFRRGGKPDDSERILTNKDLDALTDGGRA
jgi:branched-chain amino acid transport system permease protein